MPRGMSVVEFLRANGPSFMVDISDACGGALTAEAEMARLKAEGTVKQQGAQWVFTGKLASRPPPTEKLREEADKALAPIPQKPPVLRGEPVAPSEVADADDFEAALDDLRERLWRVIQIHIPHMHPDDLAMLAGMGKKLHGRTQRGNS